MKSIFLRLKRSLSARLLLVFIITSLLLEFLLVVGLVHGFSTQWRSSMRPHLEQYLDYVSADIGNPPNPERAREIAQRLPVNIFIIGPATDFSSNGLPLELDGVEFRKPRKHGFGNNGDGEIAFSDRREKTILRNRIGEFLVYYELPHSGGNRQGHRFILLALCCVIAILSVCYLVVRRMLRPVRDLRDGVKKMGQGDLTHRVPVRHNNDLGELAKSVNSMASDIEEMLDAKRQLLLGASHELRSPLTRARVAVELLDNTRQREGLVDDLNEMESLINEILESERMKSGHAALNIKSLQLEELTAMVLLEMQAPEVKCSFPANLPAIDVDETRIRILLRSLISNALIHGQGHQPMPSVTITNTAGSIRLDVKDSGNGIAPEHLEHITKPFYRADASRARTTGGFGLGLYLAKLIAQAHGGTLLIESNFIPSDADAAQAGDRQAIERGTTISLVLPTNAP